VLAGILATGLAAALGAVLTSYVGVQGTVAGAMVGAMVVSGLSQVVRWPLDRLERWLLQHGLLVVRRRQVPAARVQAVRLATDSPTSRTPRIGWRVLAIGSLGFVVGMAAISGFELSQGKPLSATTAHEERTGTTVGNLVRASVAEAEPPSTEPTAEPTAEPAATAPSRLAGDVASPGPTRTPGATSTPARAAPATPTAGPPTPGARLPAPPAGPVAPTLRPSPLPSTTASR
jgi:hypothetical protein